MFLYKNTIVSTRSGSSLERSLLTSRPAAENCRSDCVDVAGMDRNCLATFAVAGNAAACSRHQSSASTPDGADAARNRSKSLSAAGTRVTAAVARNFNNTDWLSVLACLAGGDAFSSASPLMGVKQCLKPTEQISVCGERSVVKDYTLWTEKNVAVHLTL